MMRESQKQNGVSEEELRASAEAIVKEAAAQDVEPESKSKPKSAHKTAKKAKVEVPKIGDDLDGAIGAAAGELASEHEPEPAPEAPQIQSAGSFPTVDDAFADMSKPPPAPPIEHLRLDHSSTAPRGSFRVKSREGEGFFLWMIATPYGEALQGEAFVHPIIASLRESISRECPALIPKRFEIRLIREASGKFSFLEVPADPLGTRRAEDTRQSFLKLIARAEKESVVGMKVAGNWAVEPAEFEVPDEWPEQSQGELVRLAYLEDLITTMDNPILLRFRKKIKEKK
jgi:hypothetical protein